MSTTRRHARNEDGAVLILALIVITTVALVVGTLLTQGSGSLKATVALRSVAGSSYAADGAAQIAINNLRTGYGFSPPMSELGFNNNLDGTGCFGQNVDLTPINTLTLNGFYPKTGSQSAASSAVVECAGVAQTGMQGSPVPINSSNKPGYAIVTLNGPLSTSDPLKVHGGVYSNSTIVGQVSLDAGDAWAFGTCVNTTVTAPAQKHCSTSAKIADPNYANDLGGSVPALQTPPTTCTNNVAVFQPGYYDNAATLTDATDLCSVAWFKPGTYYFDFHNNSCVNVCPANLYGSGTFADDVWAVPGDAPVIGGTPINAAGNVVSIPSANPTMPGSCQSPITDVHAVGVQFVFGGDSHMTLAKNASMELCGTYHADRPPIEIYGLKTGSTPTSATANGLNVGSVTSAGNFTGATSDNLAAAGDGKVATWTTTTATAQSTTVATQGFAPTTAIPAGAVLTSATLKVAHKDASAATTSKPTLSVKFAGAASASTPSTALTASATPVTDQIAFSASSTNTNLTIFKALQKQVHDNGYSGGSNVAYTANMKQIGSDSLDAVTLDLTYYVPVLRGEAGTCVDGTSGSCKFLELSSTGNNKIVLYLQGTTYVPYGDLNIILSNFSAEVAKFGIVARQLEFNINNGHPRWTGPIFEIPDNSPGYGYENTTVDLKVHLCPGVATCSVTAPVALTARVQLWDPTGEPVPPKRQISILSWSEQR
ncbi:MAG: hypothetical protein JWO46_2296 [Nocardioidaceae bacterium]|nr:hypothetical protein [Nocardioidaceae bacterium]